MSKGSEKSNEFRRYRLALAVLYIGTIAAGFSLLAASVVVELFFPPRVDVDGPVLSAENPDPVMLLQCNADVQGLYDELGGITTDLIDSPGQSKKRALGREWEEFGRRWIRKWHQVNARCRFEDLSGSMGAPYDRMAEVHAGLRAMRLKYQSLLVRFDKEQAAELRRMKTALDESRVGLERIAKDAGKQSRDGQQ